MILETAVDRLLPMERSYVCGHCRQFNLHQLGESATHPIARFVGRPALLLLLAGDGPAASSRLARKPTNRTLGRVQLRFLG